MMMRILGVMIGLLGTAMHKHVCHLYFVLFACTNSTSNTYTAVLLPARSAYISIWHFCVHTRVKHDTM
jgi:hypothetical protein